MEKTMQNATKSRENIQEEHLKTIPSHTSGRLIFAPRYGKTKLMLSLIKRDNPDSILWVTTSKRLIKKDLPSEFKKWYSENFLKRTTFSTYKSLHKIHGTFSLIILDEEQHITENNSVNIGNSLKYKTLLTCTGTKTKDLKKLQIFEALNLKILCEYKLKDAIKDGVLADLEIHVHYLALKKEKLKDYFRIQNLILKCKIGEYERSQNFLKIKGTYENTYYLAYSKQVDSGHIFTIRTAIGSVGYLLFENNGKSEIGKLTINEKTYKLNNGIVHETIPKSLLIQRKNAIGNSELKTEYAIKLLKNLKGKNLIFCSTIKQAERVCKNTYHSETNDIALNKFLNDEVKEIAMVNAGGTGFTYSNLDNLILTQIDSDNNGGSTQKLCRSLLKQQNYKAKIHILCVKETKDEVWVENFLMNFESYKIKTYGK